MEISKTLLAKQIKLDRLSKNLEVYDGGLGENPVPQPKCMIDTLKKYSHLILPGVGSFGRLANNLKKKDWPGEINSFVKDGKSLLGVCVGMQLLFEQSEESGVSTILLEKNMTNFGA